MPTARLLPAWTLALGLGACTSTPFAGGEGWSAPTLTGSLPTGVGFDEAATAPEQTTLPLGVGLTTGPSSTLVGATLDFPLDRRITFGPSLQHGFDDRFHLSALTGQLKYFLPIAIGEPGGFAVLPYLTAGAGLAIIDKDGRSSDSGMLFNAGAGVRFLTGDHYRIGSEVRGNFLRDEVADERAFVSFELLQVVISF